MRLTVPRRCLTPLVLMLTLVLTSCGGGTNTAGAGGSGIGGTGITTATVTGNVSQVVAMAPQGERTMTRKLLAGTLSWLSTPVNAASTPLGGIVVLGGGERTTTDDSGNFTLAEAKPSENFVLSFVFEDNETVVVPIGAVPAGSEVEVRDIVVDIEQGFAQPGDIEVRTNNGIGNGNPGNGNPGNGNPGNGNPGNGNGNPGNGNNNPGNGNNGNAGGNSQADGASGNSNANSNEQANNASGNNQAGG